MKGVHFKQANIVLKAPQGMEDDCYDLHACRYEDGYISKWQVSWKDRLQILLTGTCWLWVMSFTHPPVVICSEDPWRNQKRWRKWLHAVRLKWDARYRAKYISGEVKKAFRASGIGAES